VVVSGVVLALLVMLELTRVLYIEKFFICFF
jgi:hypothetical protein